MIALSICQPWAWVIAQGIKTIENRTWTRAYRGPIAIHAGKTHSELEWGIEFLAELGIAVDTDTLAYGAVIGTATLADVITLEEAGDDPFACGPWCWVLRDARPCVPVPCYGALGLFRLPPAVAAAVEAQTRGEVTREAE